MAKADAAESKTAMKPKKAAKPVKQGKPNIFARLGQYFKDVRSEMKRVVWPQRPEVLNSSVVVIVTLIFFVALTFFLDSIVIQVLRLIRQMG
jgi:preprotein translocase subunit SecE